LIRTSLEHVLPFGDDAAIETFYELVERVNGRAVVGVEHAADALAPDYAPGHR
jgi:hypothetical protein